MMKITTEAKHFSFCCGWQVALHPSFCYDFFSPGFCFLFNIMIKLIDSYLRVYILSLALMVSLLGLCHLMYYLSVTVADSKLLKEIQ